MPTQASYDFIIVGGGTAGLVLANRLSADNHVSVLVIEAGKDKTDDPKVSIPGFTTATRNDPEYDWCFETSPQEGLYGRKVLQNRGRLLGGSSGLNLTNLGYPSKLGIDAWSELGNHGWDWETLAPYYKKFATYHSPTEDARKRLALDHVDKNYDGTNGPIQCSYPQTFNPLSRPWADTFAKLGYAATGDSRSGKLTGAHDVAATITVDTMERSYSANAYYLSVADRPNLTLTTEATVEMVHIGVSNSHRSMATGVQYHKNGYSHSVRANKEVILCAGVFQSPQILELSGIGDKALLELHNINVTIDNANVGENLQDHILTGISFEVQDPNDSMDVTRDPKIIQQMMAEYMTMRKGPLTAVSAPCAYMPLADCLSGSGRDQIARLLDADSKDTSYPDTQAHRAVVRRILWDATEPSVYFCLSPVQMHLGADDPKLQFGNSDPRNFVTILAQHIHPFSTGSVHIKSPSALVPPDIDPKYLTHPMDVEVLARHVQWIFKIAETEPFKSRLKQNGARLPQGADLTTLDKAKEFIRHHSSTFYHPVGTCAMLPENKRGVVDTRLRVYGVGGLRVVDASVFPMIPRGNTVSTVYAVAERAADLIKEDWDVRV